ncbi:FAD-dependent oxidoreductase [Phytomonospora endophytica]|uniref:2-polyprenyl-6-methoxyphenol hydroxylase-like FAD-dependent oxidoreductase n=1 Tax=Phytomonospora endophytica TaxID=714109 RepID=A0A841G185_9ACTN|nr:NAD(P)/FAD-dependent oxidoreductase [Phytomonospora endophytica]MBB6039427.1 2-polyprenyl-6-methoxyphenol hydroxylase-like FAD-dependent oxidoreductase [Phytomonospora endophytica]GIG70154.1 monooxygenase [Phytomonospora endophytica]
MTFTVAIAGGGIGGLTLAHGLRGAGVPVTVFERDHTERERLQGYRIHISPKGCRALHECLPGHLYRAFADSSGKPNTSLGFYDEDLRRLLVIGEENPAGEQYVDGYRSVNRMALRKVLLADLDDVVVFGKRFTRYEDLPGGRVRAHFDDGTHGDADLLVGADGAGSRVREQRLPHAPRVDTGAFTISGKVALTDETRTLLPRQMFAGSGMVFGPDGKSMFLAAHEFRGERASAPADLLWDETADYIMWNMVTTWDKVGERASVTSLGPEALRDLAMEAVAGWHGGLRELMRRSDLGTVMVYPFTAATPVAAWKPSNVTLLGDAVHCMPPTAGAGANTAILDAGVLRRRITAVARGESELLAAVGAYEEEMRGYAYPTVRRALRNLRSGVSDSPFARAMTRTVFRTIDRVGPIKRKMSAAMTR